MSYIITATVDTSLEINRGGQHDKVSARVLSRNGPIVEYDIQGEFGRQGELTRQLCNTLIDAGYYDFDIAHSY